MGVQILNSLSRTGCQRNSLFLVSRRTKYSLIQVVGGSFVLGLTVRRERILLSNAARRFLVYEHLTEALS